MYQWHHFALDQTVDPEVKALWIPSLYSLIAVMFRRRTDECFLKKESHGQEIGQRKQKKHVDIKSERLFEAFRLTQQARFFISLILKCMIDIWIW